MALTSSALVLSISSPALALYTLLLIAVGEALVRTRKNYIGCLWVVRVYSVCFPVNRLVFAGFTVLETGIHLKYRFPRSVSTGVAMATGVLLSVLGWIDGSDALDVQLAVVVCNSMLWASYVYELHPRSAGFVYLLTVISRTSMVIYAGKQSLFPLVASRNGQMLLCYWAIVVPVGIAVITAVKDRISRVVVRKLFHFLSAVVFIPGIAYGKELMAIAFVGAMGGFVTVEFARKREEFGWVTRFFDGFIDVRDTGEIALTHIFLLTACGLPLLFSLHSPLPPTISFLGITVLCIGDSFAAIIGSTLGCHYIYGRKTWEGTVSNLVSMALFVYCGSTGVPVSVLALTALYETYTREIDNFSVPLFAMAAVGLVGG